MVIILMAIDEYYIVGYCWLLMSIILMVTILMAIGKYFICRILLVINAYYINGYYINGYW
jgi:hypothetical protein